MVSKGTDGRGGTSIREFKDWIVGRFLDPGVELEGSRVEGGLVDPDEPALQVNEHPKDVPEDNSVLDHVWPIPVLVHLLCSSI